MNSYVRSGEQVRRGCGTRRRTGRFQAKVTPGGRRRNSAALSAHQEALTDQERLRDLLDGLALLTDRNGQCGQSDRTTTEPAAHRVEYRAV